MSKYIKLEDAISKIVNTPTRVITDDLTALADRQHEIIDMLSNLPTIEVSEDCISRKWLVDNAEFFSQYDKNMWVVPLSKLADAPSVVTTADNLSAVEEWIEDKEQHHVELTYHCSKCGFGAWGEYEKTAFCGGCGAKMKG